MAGKVLAIKLGPWHEFGDGIVSTGYRVILSVSQVRIDVQTTTFFGQNLFQMTYSPWGVGMVDVGSLNSTSLFMNFLAPYKNRCLEWAQFVNPPYNAAFYLGRSYTLIPPPPEPPESTGNMVLDEASYDAAKGWWVRFKGNFNIAIPIFHDFPNILDCTPNFSIKIK
jgi:hypothetical protein